MRDSLVVLEVWKRNVDPLTIIDLPGMVNYGKNALDKEDRTKEMLVEMYNKYLHDKNTTICLVVSATMDI